MFSEYLGSVLESQGKQFVYHCVDNDECGRIAKQGIYALYNVKKKPGRNVNNEERKQ